MLLKNSPSIPLRINSSEEMTHPARSVPCNSMSKILGYNKINEDWRGEKTLSCFSLLPVCAHCPPAPLRSSSASGGELLRSPSPSCALLPRAARPLPAVGVIKGGLSVHLDRLAPPSLSLLSSTQSLPSSLITGAAEGAFRDTQPVCLSVCLGDENTNRAAGGGVSKDARLGSGRQTLCRARRQTSRLIFTHVCKLFRLDTVVL